MSNLNVTMRLENKVYLKIKYQSIWSTDSDSENQKDLIVEVLVEEKVAEEYLEWIMEVEILQFLYILKGWVFHVICSQ